MILMGQSCSNNKLQIGHDVKAGLTASECRPKALPTARKEEDKQLPNFMCVSVTCISCTHVRDLATDPVTDSVTDSVTVTVTVTDSAELHNVQRHELKQFRPSLPVVAQSKWSQLSCKLLSIGFRTFQESHKV